MGASNSTNKIFRFEKSQFKGNHYVDYMKSPTFFDNMVNDIDFTCISQSKECYSLFDQLKAFISHKPIKFASFSLSNYYNETFLTICSEKYCFIISIEALKRDSNKEEDILFKKEIKKLIILLTKEKIHMISSNKKSKEFLLTMISHLNEVNLISNQDELILTSNIKFLDKDLVSEINESVGILIDYSKKSYKIPAFDISKEAILNFMIGRFYGKSKYFESPTFFECDFDNSQFNDFNLYDFIPLSQIHIKISILFHIKTNHLFIQKRLVELEEYENIKREKKFTKR